MAWADLAFTLAAILIWNSIPEIAFRVICSGSSCTLSPFEQGFQTTVYYAWGFFIVKFILAFPGAMSLIYLCLPIDSSSKDMPVATAVAEPATVNAAGREEGGEMGQGEGLAAQEEGAASTDHGDAESAGRAKGDGFDKDGTAPYITGSAGDPNPSWLQP